MASSDGQYNPFQSYPPQYSDAAAKQEKKRLDAILALEAKEKAYYADELKKYQNSLAREVNKNRKLLPPSNMTPMDQLNFWRKSFFNKKGGRRSNKKAKKGKKGTRRH